MGFGHFGGHGQTSERVTRSLLTQICLWSPTAAAGSAELRGATWHPREPFLQPRPRAHAC